MNLDSLGTLGNDFDIRDGFNYGIQARNVRGLTSGFVRMHFHLCLPILLRGFWRFILSHSRLAHAKVSHERLRSC